MSFDYINEAFRKLSLLKEETFDTSKDGINRLSTFIDEDDAVDTLDVIDVNASTEDELEDSYVGKVIIDCNVCHSHIFKARDEIVIDTDGVVNIEDECPYCGEKSGFIVVGEIVEFNPEKEETTDPEISVEVDGEDIPTEDDTTNEPQELDESKKSRSYSKRILKMLGEDSTDDSDEEIIEESTAVLDRPRDLTTISGTIANVLNRHSSSIDACGGNEIAVKRTVENILRSEDVKDPQEAERAISIINSCKGPKLWTTLASYMTGDKVIPVGKFAKRRLDASLENDTTLTEAVNNVNVETDDSVVNVHTEENGKVVVSTEPKVEEIPDEETEEMVAPLSDETITEIENENGVSEIPEEDMEDTPEEDVEDVDVEIDEIDEESLDELGESYLRNVYDNVESFKTTSVSNNDTHMILEGIITFTSGTTKKTGFIFEAKEATPSGKVSFVGMNEHFSKKRNAFKLEGVVKNNKFLPESLTYNYRTLLNEDVNTVSGTVTVD